MSDQFWLVWCATLDIPTQHKHGHPEAARREAEGLAKLSPGHKFHVLALIGTCEIAAVKWANFDADVIPF